MNKAVAGIAAVGAVVGARHVIKRVGPKMQEHCEQMMGAASAGRSEATSHKAAPHRMREHCEKMAAHTEDRREPVAAA